MLRSIFKYSRYIIFASIFFYGVIAKVPFFQPYTVWLAQIMNKVGKVLFLNAKEPILRIMSILLLAYAIRMIIWSVQGYKNGYFSGYTGKSASRLWLLTLCLALGLFAVSVYALCTF